MEKSLLSKDGKEEKRKKHKDKTKHHDKETEEGTIMDKGNSSNKKQFPFIEK